MSNKATSKHTHVRVKSGDSGDQSEERMLGLQVHTQVVGVISQEWEFMGAG